MHITIVFCARQDQHMRGTLKNMTKHFFLYNDQIHKN